MHANAHPILTKNEYTIHAPCQVWPHATAVSKWGTCPSIYAIGARQLRCFESVNIYYIFLHNTAGSWLDYHCWACKLVCGWLHLCIFSLKVFVSFHCHAKSVAWTNCVIFPGAYNVINAFTGFGWWSSYNEIFSTPNTIISVYCLRCRLPQRPFTSERGRRH
jgi:hypothetical protein